MGYCVQHVAQTLHLLVSHQVWLSMVCGRKLYGCTVQARLNVNCVESVEKRKQYNTRSWRIFSIHSQLKRLGLELLTGTAFHHFLYYKKTYEPVPNLYGGELVIVSVDSWRSLMEKRPLYRGFKAIQQKKHNLNLLSSVCVFLSSLSHRAPRAASPHSTPVLLAAFQPMPRESRPWNPNRHIESIYRDTGNIRKQ